MDAPEVELKEVQDAQKRSSEAAEELENWATDTAAQLATSLRRIAEVKKNTKKATDSVRQ